jgi:hypothetical protein
MGETMEISPVALKSGDKIEPITMESINNIINGAITPHTYVNKILKIINGHGITLTELEYIEITDAVVSAYQLGESNRLKQVLTAISKDNDGY